MSNHPDLSIIIVSTNEAHWLQACLRSVYAHAGDALLDVVVVDNESTDGTGELVSEQFKQARVVRSINRGFAHANNRGAVTSTARYILFLNPDTEVTAGTFGELVATLDRRLDVGLAGVKQLTGDGSLFPTIRRFPNAARAFGEALTREQWRARPSWLGERDLDLASYELERDCDWTSGSFMCARREALLSAGLLDERFFIYCEEPDLCLRLKRAGWKTMHTPTMTIVHHAGKAGIRPRLVAQEAFARRQYADKHFGPAHRALYLGAVGTRYALRALASGDDNSTDLRAAARRALSTLVGRAEPPFAQPPATALAPDLVSRPDPVEPREQSVIPRTTSNGHCSGRGPTGRPRALVTGAAGFMGSHVADACLALGMDVVATDDLSGGYRQNVPDAATWLEGDLCDGDFVESLWDEGPYDYVYHLAAYAAEGLSHFIRAFNYRTNLEASVNLINRCVRFGVQRFVFTSSIAVYGAGQVPMSEQMVPRPEDPYGISKYAVELDLMAAHEMFGLDYTVFRPHNVYGERQNIADKYRNVIGIFMNAILRGGSMPVFGDGTQTRAFSHIADVAPVIACSPLVAASANETFNIGADTPYSILELAAVIADAFGVECDLARLPARNEVVNAFSDHSKVRAVFDPPEPIDLREGIRRMATWVNDHGSMDPVEFRGQIEIERNLPPSWTTSQQSVPATAAS